jgi:sialic acid synthase SpsE
MTPFIIADIGSNHRGELDNALKAIECAKERGADAVKFQMFTARELYGLDIEMPFALPPDWLPKLADLSSKVGIGFMCSAFSPEGVAIVDPYVQRHKLASSEFCHVGIIDAMIDTGKSIIASTGGQGHLDVQGFIQHTMAVRGLKTDMLTLLECVALYPAPASAYDLNVLHAFRFGNTTAGISDHTLGNVVAVAAVGAGATVFEKHLDPFFGTTETPDSCVSVSPAEFQMYCQDIREAASALGDGIKQPRHQHKAQLQWKRRLIATQRLSIGDTLRYNENYGIFRSLKDDTNGLPPWAYEQVNGRTMTKAVEPGDSIGPRDTQ